MALGVVCPPPGGRRAPGAEEAREQRKESPGSPEGIDVKVRGIIGQRVEVSPEQLRPEAAFVDALKADSLAVVELVLALEQEFRLEIPEEDTEQIKTVKDALNYIKTHAK